MIKKSTDDRSPIKILWITLLLSGSYWILEALIHTIFFPSNYQSHQLGQTTFLTRFLYEFLHPDSHEFYMHLLIPILMLGFGAYLYWLIRQQLSKQEHSALSDELTDLPNRKPLVDRIESTLKLSRRKFQPFALFHINPARMTEVNNTLGHDTGDKLIQLISERLQSTLRTSDTIARLESDEFILLLPETGLEDIDTIVEKIKAAFEAPFALANSTIGVELAIGIAVYPQHGEETNALLQHASTAMHLAKNNKQIMQVYSEQQDSANTENLTLFQELRHAIMHDELMLTYQPKININTSAVVGLEALVRWQHPTKGLISPQDFVPIVEHTGLVHQMTEWVINESMRQSHIWQQQKLPINISINLSASNLLNKKLPGFLLQATARHKISPQDITLELTESMIMKNPIESLETLKQLNKQNFTISIDDYGTGYSSLAYLQNLPAHELKIGKPFSSNLLENTKDEQIVRSVIELAHSLNMKVVAEGVETKEILERLKKLGCDIAQGHYFSKPMPAEKCTEWLRQRFNASSK
ncbi:MAG: hypothetical protein A3C55_05735 [Gammaproteobacteria bacterium RIFCSPHIGHO2_02_FULL_42_13]|nr:MAG: hypothetical protein A3C55_05735 [Gammaproteobacteria bacterium RIFCSPHIGHO2_02_FULL_42_13]OGT70399.1 MAG: hypothetical protein A3H43_06535 [Gammaproteobacteria bacterium RIFCSPLOWO2_02_FULL_42_9]